MAKIFGGLLSGGKNKERTPEEEANRVRLIKLLVTVTVILLLAASTSLTWNSDGGYQFRIATDHGYNWKIELEDPSMLRIDSQELTDGKFIGEVKGVTEGRSKVTLTCYEEADPSNVSEIRYYEFQITEDLRLRMRGVEREFPNKG